MTSEGLPIITLLPLRLCTRFSRLYIQRATIYGASKFICHHPWHSYIHHPTSSTNEARRIFGQVFTRLSHYSTDTPSHNGIRHIVARHRRGEGNITVRVDED
jgi:hypothetical protein